MWKGYIYLLLKAGSQGASLWKQPMVFPARNAFIKVNLERLRACAVAGCAESKSKVVPNKNNNNYTPSGKKKK